MIFIPSLEKYLDLPLINVVMNNVFVFQLDEVVGASEEKIREKIQQHK
jgi:hypothetical protein